MDRLTTELATRLLAEFEARNKVGPLDGWTVLSKAIFRGRVMFAEPFLEPLLAGVGNSHASISHRGA